MCEGHVWGTSYVWNDRRWATYEVCLVYDRVQEPYRGRARFVQQLTFYIVTRPKLMFFMQNFKGFPMSQLLLKLSDGALGFFPAKRAFCPFCNMYARALSPKIYIPQANQAKIKIFCVQFQQFSNAAFACQLIVRGTGVFSRQMSIFRFFPKNNNWKVTFKRIVMLTCINRAKCIF